MKPFSSSLPPSTNYFDTLRNNDVIYPNTPNYPNNEWIISSSPFCHSKILILTLPEVRLGILCLGVFSQGTGVIGRRLKDWGWANSLGFSGGSCGYDEKPLDLIGYYCIAQVLILGYIMIRPYSWINAGAFRDFNLKRLQRGLRVYDTFKLACSQALFN